MGCLLTVWLLTTTATAPVHAADGDDNPDPIWQRIEFPTLPIIGSSSEQARFMVLVSDGTAGNGPNWQFYLMCPLRDGEKVSGNLADPSKIIVQWHRADGSVTPSKIAWNHWSGPSGAGATQWSLIYDFPRDRNDLDEAWVEVQTPGRTYFFELPYGYTRPQKAPKIPEPRRGRPAMPAALQIGEDGLLVPWKSVTYDFPDTQDGMRCSLRISNPLNPVIRTTLYFGNQPRDLNEPPTGMQIEQAGLALMKGRKIAVRLLDHTAGRGEEFRFSSDSGPEEARTWGRVIFTAGDRRWECVVPSSLFRYAHGLSNYDFPRRYFAREVEE